MYYFYYYLFLKHFRFEWALQQNETFNVFTNDYMELGEEESAFGTKSDNHLKVRKNHSGGGVNFAKKI